MDIEPILRYWLEIADDMHVSIIKMHRKQVQIQIEIDNVIFCYFNPTDHPQGFRLGPYKSYLAYFRAKWGRRRYFLEPDDLMKLKQEIISFFLRGLAYFKLCEFHAAAADAKHGIEIIQFSLKTCSNKRNAWLLERLLPKCYFLYYLSLACISLQQGKIQCAVRYLDDGSKKIQTCYKKIANGGEKIDGREVQSLNHFKKNILAAGDRLDLQQQSQFILQQVRFRKNGNKFNSTLPLSFSP